jgi:deazaflavin-dependent oxidoreductase (nitroreductase family)
VTAALDSLAAEAFCYVTTTGRRTGNPHEIEIWFGLNERTLYMLSGGSKRSDWVRNIMQTPEVGVRIGGRTFRGAGRIVSDAAEDKVARRLLLQKYSPTYEGDLTDWGRTALPIAVDLALD